MVSTSQRTVHPRLPGLLARHQRRSWLAPLHAPSVAAFAALQNEVNITARPIVLDSGCGTGASTRLIAQAFPNALVIGVDKSVHRLGRTGAAYFPYREENAVWLRADLPTFWRLALKAGWRLARHYLLYPNPWPKPGHVQRRWHAHPVFPDLLRLGGRLEMRCNWELYAHEFAAAVNSTLETRVRPQPLAASVVSSPFERKYRAAGHSLWSVSVDCGAGGV